MYQVSRHINRKQRSANATRGFSLMELLVGMTIFITIMASVTLMFNAVVRTTKIGYQNQRAFEVVRGVFNTIENDVTRAFTSRETGLKDTFYGTPYGFTFIGMVDADGDGEFNLARITYVIFSDLNDDHFTAGLKGRYTSVADDVDDSEDRITYSLIRFIEPGMDTLDSFPIDWDSAVAPSDGSGTTLAAAITAARANATIDNICADSACLDEIEKAKKRELWIRMLSGDESVPRFWTLGVAPIVRSAGLNGVLNPEDYVLAENILHIDRLELFDPVDFDTYDRLDLTDEPLISPTGDEMAEVYLLLADEALYAADYVAAFPLQAPRVSTNDYFFTYREYNNEYVKQNANGVNIQKVTQDGVPAVDNNGNDIFETVLSNNLFSFWNDTRNLEHSIAVDDPTLGELTPDVLDPALPESIQLQFTLFYPSPYPGAPDFEKTFTHQINLPTALRQKEASLETLLLREVD